MTSPSVPASTSSLNRQLLLSGLGMGLAGWIALALLMLFTTPTLGPRWLFFFLLFLALAGTAMPVVWYLNRRFSPNPFPPPGVIWREALIVAVWGIFLIWLRVGRLLTPFTAWSLTGAFFAVELLLRMYERSRWAPSSALPPEPESAEASPPQAEDDEGP